MPDISHEIAERLIEFGQSLFGSKHGWKTRFAEYLGMDIQGLNPYLKGQKPGNFIQDRLRSVNAPVEWIMTGEKQDDRKDSIPLMQIPVYAHINAGAKKWVVAEQPVEHIGIPYNADKTRFGLIVKGNSMAPEINDGDIVIVSEKAHVKNGDLAVVEWDDGETHLRVVTFQKEMIVLSSNNAAEYPPLFTDKKRIHKMLRVMQHIRNY
jgi:phage repressor protein C with HTH and peptisase S24 domain